MTSWYRLNGLKNAHSEIFIITGVSTGPTALKVNLQTTEGMARTTVVLLFKLQGLTTLQFKLQGHN